MQLEQEKSQKEKDCAHLDLELEKVNEALAKSNKDRRSLEEKLQEAQASLNSEEDKANHLNKVKARLDASLAELQDEVAKEKAAKADGEKHRRKLEGELKVGDGGVHSCMGRGIGERFL